MHSHLLSANAVRGSVFKKTSSATLDVGSCWTVLALGSFSHCGAAADGELLVFFFAEIQYNRFLLRSNGCVAGGTLVEILFRVSSVAIARAFYGSMAANGEQSGDWSFMYCRHR